jgi:hypothetical protein
MICISYEFSLLVGVKAMTILILPVANPLKTGTKKKDKTTIKFFMVDP